MEKKKTIRVIGTVITAIRRVSDPKFRFPGGGRAETLAGKFYDEMMKRTGDVAEKRVVDYCVYFCHTRGDRPFTAANVMSTVSLGKFLGRNYGQTFFEDRWLRKMGLSREGLEGMIRSPSEHPLAKYIYVEAEETTKKRCLGTAAGYVICQSATPGWSPLSEACSSCPSVEKCRKRTGKRNMELYRLRVAYEERN